MADPDVMSKLFEKLEQTGLADRPGALLYSHPATVCPGPLYMIGLNPGGNPDIERTSVRQHLIAISTKPLYWSEFISESWAPRGRIYPPGEAGMQRRVRKLHDSLGLRTVDVCASNLIFVRSKVGGDLSEPAKLAELCWPVHDYILRQVRPRAILAIGKKAFDSLCAHSNLIGDEEKISAGRSKLSCYAVRARTAGLNIMLLSVPHLGETVKYDISVYPEVVSWIKRRLDTQH